MNNIIGVINSGVGNIHSVNKALSLFNVKVVKVTNQDELFSCDKVVIPGVGAMHSAMSFMAASGLKDALIEYANQNK